MDARDIPSLSPPARFCSTNKNAATDEKMTGPRGGSQVKPAMAEARRRPLDNTAIDSMARFGNRA